MKIPGFQWGYISTVLCDNASVNLFCVDDKGCSYCGGLGHRITECPKLESVQQKKAGSMSRRDFLAESAADY